MARQVYRCVILDDYQGGVLAAGDWSSLEPAVEVEAICEHIAEPARLAERLQGAAILIAIRERTALSRDLLERLPDLKLLVTFGMSNAAIDLQAAEELGITVCGTTGAGEPTVEMTWALILSLLRNVPAEATAFARGGPWQQTVGTGLFGKTLGLVGLGRVGRGVARVGHAFGMNVLAYTPTLTTARAEEVGVTAAPHLDMLLQEADIVSLHLPLNDDTRGLIGKAEIARMKSTAYLINSSRGPIVDEQALIEALKARRIAGAALDVFNTEPLPKNHALRGLDNLVATPHLGYVTRENYARHAADAIDDIAAWINGKSVRRIVASD
ncbi:D-2-hydroxyacid dehydrogenase family protein [Chelativorans sp. AA-79]|uniref:D-2-hydroxyacid dehydrogenase family protein n=1 Tax=Chelativorans sp. AA-79 TaxID=3028735 RepID=UPI0023F6C9E6|nr:D-2-hydroxyacid dehydrogenase family protein [Chelativorans sp. AA-79]WEX09049.1 D-2-hydroxyacid dehydrogenase family protein [Chelativorans sp. AA-79]